MRITAKYLKERVKEINELLKNKGVNKRLKIEWSYNYPHLYETDINGGVIRQITGGNNKEIDYYLDGLVYGLGL
ncbi:hypothetical protein [Persephonella sp.]